MDTDIRVINTNIGVIPIGGEIGITMTDFLVLIPDRKLEESLTSLTSPDKDMDENMVDKLRGQDSMIQPQRIVV